MHRITLLLSILITMLAVLVSSVGLFYDDGGESYNFLSIHGENVEMFGNGIYSEESYFKAPILKGTDAVILFLVVPLFVLSIYLNKNNTLRLRLINLGLLSSLLYYSASLSFGVPYNRLYLAYLLLFSACLFSFIISINFVDLIKLKRGMNGKVPHKSITVFMILAGLSVFVWFFEIITSIKTGRPPEIIGANTTEPTFILDLGIIAPLAFATAYLVFKKRPLGYLLSVILLTLNAIVGLIVISQSIFQKMYGVILSIEEFIPYVLVFSVMSLFAIFLNIKLLKSINV